MHSEDQVRDFADRAIRNSLHHPENLRGLIEQAAPELAPGFDFFQAKLLDREFPLDDWRRREADLPFEIPFRSGAMVTPALVVVLIEHQSDTDPLMPLRTLYFAVTYWDRQWRAWQDSPAPRLPLKLHPVFPLVFHTGPAPWGSNRSLVELLDIPEAFHEFAPKWEPLFWNLADKTTEALLASSNGWVQMLAVIRSEREEARAFQTVFDRTMERLKSLSTLEPARWYDLMRIALAWAMWRRPSTEKNDLVAVAIKHQATLDKQTEIENMANQLGPTMVDIARHEGKLIASRQALAAFLKGRFGALPQQLQDQIEGIDDLDRLERAIRQVADIKSLKELEL